MNLASKVLSSHQQRPVYVIGAAFVDLVMNTPTLPTRGDDVFVDSSAITVGGCALNIARIHKSLGLDIVAGIPVGQGLWANHIRHTLEQEDITLTQQRDSGDNGWCIAMVEADGERTFLSSAGVEADWTIEHLRNMAVKAGSIVYLSGYQLAAEGGDIFLDWIEELDRSVSILIDPGPRLVDLSEQQLQRLYDRGVIFSLNRREAELLAGEDDMATFSQKLSERCGQPVIVRVDKDGAWIFNAGQEPQQVKPFTTQVVDTIGAGDAHAAGLLYGMALGLPIADAVQAGNATGSDAVSREGASHGLTRDQLAAILQS